MDMKFDFKGDPVGGVITTYLLEKVSQPPFHIPLLSNQSRGLNSLLFCSPGMYVIEEKLLRRIVAFLPKNLSIVDVECVLML